MKKFLLFIMALSPWLSSGAGLTAPQQGIALRDGTLVMPTQGRDAADQHFSNLLISRDHGKTWAVSPPASFGNTECQAMQLADGSIMLNCRTESPTKFRTVAVTLPRSNVDTARHQSQGAHRSQLQRQPFALRLPRGWPG